MDIILSFSAVLITPQWKGNGWVKILQQILSGMTVGWKSLHVFLFLLLLHLHFHSPLWKQSNNWKLTASNRALYLIHCFDICGVCNSMPRKGKDKHLCRRIAFLQVFTDTGVYRCGDHKLWFRQRHCLSYSSASCKYRSHFHSCLISPDSQECWRS